MPIEFRFGYKITWITLRSTDQAKVLRALNVSRAKRIGWEQGINEAYKENGVFISSPVRGWIFVVSHDLMGFSEESSLTEELKRPTLFLTF